MQGSYHIEMKNPNLNTLGYVIGTANLSDKHDRSTPSDYHWKVLKCRMIIFSNSSIMACPDKNNLKKVHVIFNKIGDHYDKLNSLFLKFSISQEGVIKETTPEIFQMCFEYTLTAKLAPSWNTLGSNYLVNNRDFLTIKTAVDGIRYKISSYEKITAMDIKPVKINLIRSDEDYLPGEWIRVLPSLNKAIVDKHCESLPTVGNFKCYKDLRRHWKNIHGYRLPEEESFYYSIQFWRGEPLTYPSVCVIRNFPIITPVPKSTEKIIIGRFLGSLKCKMGCILGDMLLINDQYYDKHVTQRMQDSQAVSLCTPTQFERPA